MKSRSTSNAKGVCRCCGRPYQKWNDRSLAKIEQEQREAIAKIHASGGSLEGLYGDSLDDYEMINFLRRQMNLEPITNV